MILYDKLSLQFLLVTNLTHFFSMYLLFHLSTYFEHSVLVIRRVKLY